MKYGGWGLSALAKYQSEGCYRRDPSSKTGVRVHFTPSDELARIYSVNLPD